MQHRRLIRARDLAAFRGALVELARDGAPADARGAPSSCRRARRPSCCARPSRASLAAPGHRRGGWAVAACRDLLPTATRAEWLERLLAALPGPPARLLSRVEREVLLERAARRRAAAARAWAARRSPCGRASSPRCSISTTSCGGVSAPVAARYRRSALFAQLRGRARTPTAAARPDPPDLLSRRSAVSPTSAPCRTAARWTSTCCARLLLDEQPALPYRPRRRRPSPTSRRIRAGCGPRISICSAGCRIWRGSTSWSPTRPTTRAFASGSR